MGIFMSILDFIIDNILINASMVLCLLYTSDAADEL